MDKRATLAVILMTKNEEAGLASCLSRVADWADEIVVIDDESTDRTVEIAKRFTDKIRVAASEDNHDRQWNRGIDAASADWILHIDVDEVVTPKLKEAINGILVDDQGHSGFELWRKNYFLGRPMRHGGWHHRYLVLFQRARTRCAGRGIHVQVKVDGTIGQLDAEVEHHPFNSLQQFIDRQNLYSRKGAEVMAADAPPAMRRVVYQTTLRPLKLFWKFYGKKKAKRDGWHGLVFSFLFAFAHFVFWAKVWEQKQVQT